MQHDSGFSPAGMHNTLALIDAEFLKLAGIPVFILFDNVDASTSKRKRLPPGSPKELAALHALLRDWPRNRDRPQVVSFPLPDVLCAIPDEVVDRVVSDEGGRFNGWATVIQAYRLARERRNFKDFFLSESGLTGKVNATELLRRLLRQTPKGATSPLHRPVNEILSAEHRNSDSAIESPAEVPGWVSPSRRRRWRA